MMQLVLMHSLRTMYKRTVTKTWFLVSNALYDDTITNICMCVYIVMPEAKCYYYCYYQLYQLGTVMQKISVFYDHPLVCSNIFHSLNS